MNTEKLVLARKYAKEVSENIPSESRPAFHLTPQVGWMNDPNGFSFYKGEYHLFYQSYPYDTVWNSMHWGHAVSKDLIHWDYLPYALAPEEKYDSFGCFSGSALELADGRHLIMYTGVHKEGTDPVEEIQEQCIAVGDGTDYVKYENNPVLDRTCLPEKMSKADFRDPKIWQEADGSFKCVVGTCDKDRIGAILLCGSKDGFDWKYESTLIENDGKFGLMWECPDFFALGDKHVLLCSPQDMIPEGKEYPNGNGTLCLIGRYDDVQKKFVYEKNQAVDYGIDFYAPQTLLAPDGRRIMIAWMQNWDTCNQTERNGRKWFGQMTLPRELTIKNGRLYQVPVRELESYRKNKVAYHYVAFSGEMSLDGIEGRTVDMEIVVRPLNRDEFYQKFAIRFAQDDKFRTAVSFRPHESVLKIDRRYSGSRREYVHQRSCQVLGNKEELKLRIILDRYSAEVFVNDGEEAMTLTFQTDLSAKGISFYADGDVVMDVTKYDLLTEEMV